MIEAENGRSCTIDKNDMNGDSVYAGGLRWERVVMGTCLCCMAGNCRSWGCVRSNYVCKCKNSTIPSHVVEAKRDEIRGWKEEYVSGEEQIVGMARRQRAKEEIRVEQGMVIFPRDVEIKSCTIEKMAVSGARRRETCGLDGCGGCMAIEVDDGDNYEGIHKLFEETSALVAPVGHADTLRDYAHEEEKAFRESSLKFPTDRRVADFRRPVDNITGEEEVQEWFRASKITIGDNLSADELIRVQRLLYTWRTIFWDDPRAVPATDLVTHTISTHRWAKPHNTRMRNLNQKELEFFMHKIPSWEAAGVIHRCNSPWSAKTTLVPKKDGTLRMTQSYIQLNAATIKSNYRMRRIEPILQGLSRRRAPNKRKFHGFSDAANGFYAVPLHRAHAYKTAFPTPLGQYCYLRMGQGLTGSPGTYARLKDIVTGDIPGQEGSIEGDHPDVSFYHFVDDNYSAGERFEEYYQFLHDKYFPRVSWGLLTLKPSKCFFFTEGIVSLGFELNQKGAQASADKVAKIRDYPVPTNLEQVEKFLYMATYLKSLIPGRAEHSRILKEAAKWKIEKIKEGKKTRTKKELLTFEWGPEQDASFASIKDSIVKHNMSGGDPNKQYYLATDALLHGLGGVLFQIDDLDEPEAPLGAKKRRAYPKGRERVIMFISQRFNDAETRYHTTEREALAVLRCLEEVRWLVIGSKYLVIVYTDHEALVSILNKGDTAKGRIVGWQIRFSEYDFNVRRVKEDENRLADGMLRLPPDFMSPAREQGTEPDLENVMLLERDNWEPWLQDEWYGEIVHYKVFGTLKSRSGDKRKERQIRLQSHKYRLIETEQPGTRYVQRALARVESREGGLSRCVRKHEVVGILERYHERHGHFVAAIMARNLVGKWYWPGRSGDIQQWCRSCEACQKLGPVRVSTKTTPIVQIQPLDMIGIDFIRPIKSTSSSAKYAYILIAVDYFSRYMWATPCVQSTGAIVAEFLLQVARQVGWPQAIYCDNGSHFVQGILPGFLRDRNVTQCTAPITNPQSVGLAERHVQMVLAGLRAKIQNKSDMKHWDLDVQHIVDTINTRVLRVHGYTPSQLLMGFNIWIHDLEDTLDDDLRNRILEQVVEQAQARGDPVQIAVDKAQYDLRVAQVEEIRDQANQCVMENILQLADNAPDPRFRPPAPGDLVLLRDHALDKDYGRKLEPRWLGLYKLLSVTPNGISGVIQDLHTEATKGRHALNSLKVFVPRNWKQDNRGEIDPRDDVSATLLHEYRTQGYVDLVKWVGS